MFFEVFDFWTDDVSLTRVDKNTPLTGTYAHLTGCGKTEPINLNFENGEITWR